MELEPVLTKRRSLEFTEAELWTIRRALALAHADMRRRATRTKRPVTRGSIVAAMEDTSVLAGRLDALLEPDDDGI